MPAISPARREPNGRRQRPVLEQIKQAQESATKREIAANQAVVLRQPHRRGNDNARLESPFGRFVDLHKMPDEIWKAGEEHEGRVRRWRSAMQVPTDVRAGESGGDGPDWVVVQGWLREIRDCESAMNREVRGGASLVCSLVCDHREAYVATSIIRRALVALAQHLGYLRY